MRKDFNYLWDINVVEWHWLLVSWLLASPDHQQNMILTLWNSCHCPHKISQHVSACNDIVNSPENYKHTKLSTETYLLLIDRGMGPRICFKAMTRWRPGQKCRAAGHKQPEWRHFSVITGCWLHTVPGHFSRSSTWWCRATLTVTPQVSGRESGNLGVPWCTWVRYPDGFPTMPIRGNTDT